MEKIRAGNFDVEITARITGIPVLTETKVYTLFGRRLLLIICPGFRTGDFTRRSLRRLRLEWDHCYTYPISITR